MQTPWRVIRFYLFIWLFFLAVLLIASIIRHWVLIRAAMMGSVSQLISTGILIAIFGYLIFTLFRGR